MLIVFEGMDACGKATQSKMFTQREAALRIEFPTYETETDALTGPVIADHLHHKWAALTHDCDIRDPCKAFAEDVKLDALVFQCLMSMNKYEMAPTIQQELDEGRTVVLDRYWPSAYAYGCADGLDPAWLLRIHEMLPKPDLCILLDVDYETSLTRRPNRRDRYEQKGKDYFDRVAANYRRLWLEVAPLTNFWASSCLNKYTEWIVIDGRRPVEEVTQQINTMYRNMR